MMAVEPATLNPDTALLGVEEDDDDYEPDLYGGAEDAEQLQNKLDSAPSQELPRNADLPPTLSLGSFALPPPTVIAPETAARNSLQSVSRMFALTKSFEDAATGGNKKQHPNTNHRTVGLSRLAASSFDKDAWLTVITRLATRGTAGLGDVELKDEYDPASTPSEGTPKTSCSSSFSNMIRDRLFAHVLEDFRRRIDLAVDWLSEEWYNDKVRAMEATRKGLEAPPGQFETWALKIIDGFLPYLQPGDKVLTRFLSEIPHLSPALLQKVTSLCRDPSMVNLVLSSLAYLAMLRPPVKELVLGTLEEIWTECESSNLFHLATWIHPCATPRSASFP